MWFLFHLQSMVYFIQQHKQLITVKSIVFILFSLPTKHISMHHVNAYKFLSSKSSSNLKMRKHDDNVNTKNVRCKLNFEPGKFSPNIWYSYMVLFQQWCPYPEDLPQLSLWPCRNHLETSQLICPENQLTGFCMIGTLVVKRLIKGISAT